MTPPKLRVEGLNAGYGLVRVIHDMDLELPSGTISAILGPNGAGKSTTCKTLAGYLDATAGRIALDGQDVTARQCWWRARQGILLVPEGRGIFPGLSVDDNLRMLLPRAVERSQVYDRFADTRGSSPAARGEPLRRRATDLVPGAGPDPSHAAADR